MTNKNERNFYDTIETARCGVARDIHFLRYVTLPTAEILSGQKGARMGLNGFHIR